MGCSGAFTVEQILSKASPKAKLWGNDVSLYSGVLGAYLAGQPFRMEVREEKFAWLEPYLGDVEGKAATVMVLFEMLKYEKANNLFKQRHWGHYLDNFKDFHQGTVAKLQERNKEIRLEAYTSRDIFDLLDEIPKDAVVIAFLPTYAGGYERMFKRLEEIFDWDRPNYGLIDEERKKRTVMKMMEQDYLYLDDHEWKDLPMVAVVRKARMKPVYVYSNMAALHRGVMKQQRHSEFVPFARLGDEDEITPASKLTIAPTTVGSRTGAPTVGSGGFTRAFALGLSPAPLVTFPAPATSNAACRFPALRFPGCFVPRVMGPIRPGALSAAAGTAESGSPRRAPDCYRATAYSTSSNRSPDVSGPASSAAAAFSPPNRGCSQSNGSKTRWQNSSPSPAKSG